MDKYKFDIKINTKLSVRPAMPPINTNEKIMWERIENSLDIEVYKIVKSLETYFQLKAEEMLKWEERFIQDEKN